MILVQWIHRENEFDWIENYCLFLASRSVRREMVFSMQFSQKRLPTINPFAKNVSKEKTHSILCVSLFEMCERLWKVELCERTMTIARISELNFQLHVFGTFGVKQTNEQIKIENQIWTNLLFWFELELFQRRMEYIWFYYCDWKYRWCSYYRSYRKFQNTTMAHTSLQLKNWILENSPFFFENTIAQRKKRILRPEFSEMGSFF